MKVRKNAFAVATMLLLGTASFLGGCATTGMDRSVKTTNSIQEVDGEIRKMMVQIDATGSALDNLALAQKPDLKKSFDLYSKELLKLDHEGQKTLKRIDEMRSNSKEYFSEWEKQGDTFTNPQIRELSEERRSRLATIYAQVPAAGTGIKGAFHAYLTDLKEIQMFLSNDLTPSGVESIDPVAKKTVQDRETLKASFGPVISALDDIKVELYSGKK
jgi:seryl-tRNA synthetase